MLYEYPAIFHTIEEGYQISFPDFGRSIRADLRMPVWVAKDQWESGPPYD